jgi:hypothetical protein
LALFAFGVAILGIYHAFRINRTDWVFRKWREDANNYTSNQILWNELLDADNARSKRLVWLQALLAYLSLISFYVGLGIAIFHFDGIATPPGGKNEQQAITAPAQPAATKAATPRTKDNSGQGAAVSRKDSHP